MNTLILSPNGGSIGIGYATRSNDIRIVAEQIIATGKMTRAGLGVQIAEVPEELAAQYGLENGVGVLIVGIAEGRPASLSGIMPNDIILEIDGEPITSTTQMTRKIASYQPQDTITISVMSDGDIRSISVALSEREHAVSTFQAVPEPDVENEPEEQEHEQQLPQIPNIPNIPNIPFLSPFNLPDFSPE